MIFNTLQFLPFIIVVLALHYTLPWRVNKYFLCLASYFFYASFNPVYVVLLWLSTIIDFICARKLDRAKQRRKFWLIISLCVNLGILGIFKYGAFFTENIAAVLSITGFNLGIQLPAFLLPVGISFYTFQTMSYTLDVYRKKLKPTNPLDFALFVAFFPQLVAGPIVRAVDFLPQLIKRRRLTLRRISMGCFLILTGFFKKIVLADAIASSVGQIFADPGIYSALDRIIGVFGFSMQIFLDFSGYSDIAIGLALLMGFRLKRNFRFPYLAKGFSDFWRRWHISLSSWIRDYVYIPLGGSRVSQSRHLFNLLFVMTLFGLWHGASWMFVLWGLLHGIYLAVERQLKRMITIPSHFIWDSLKVGLTFLIVCLTWIFFRSKSMADAGLFLESFIDIGHWQWAAVTQQMLLSYIGVFLIFHGVVYANRYTLKVKRLPYYIYAGISAFMLFFILTGWESNNVFIYFQF